MATDNNWVQIAERNALNVASCNEQAEWRMGDDNW